MHLEALAPRVVFLTAHGDDTPAFLAQLLGDRTDVIGLESAAAADVS